VLCGIFGTYFALNKEKAKSWLTTLQFWIVAPSCAVMSGALYFLLPRYETMVPVVAIASLAYAGGAALFVRIVFMPESHAPVLHGHAHS
jgi:peptidoglycan/LPS O-acetylase OafA/YrhL